MFAKLCQRCFSSFYGADSSTIYALATGGLRSALSVIRVSGPICTDVVHKLGRYSGRKFPKPREATLRKLYDPANSNLLDHGIILWFPGPNSYTGEDSCEFHIHGGPAVISGVLKAIGSIPGCRIAEPGEFTRRSFINGKMDLTQVDGLADLIAAETEMQKMQALKQMGGSLSRIYHEWRDRLAKCLANSEAFIDFGEDENIESDVMEDVIKQVESLVEEIQKHLHDHKRGQRLRDGIRVALIGRPNVGKSTLMNKLCGRDAAIVSNIPGTTRDVVNSCVNIHGFPVVFADTAGIRSETPDLIETEGIKRSLKEVEESDLILLIADASEFSKYSFDNNDASSLKKSLLKDLCSIDFLNTQKTIIMILNKVDLSPEAQDHLSFDCTISCKNGEGVEKMHNLIQEKIIELCGDPTKDAPTVTQERYRVELERCLENLVAFLDFKNSDIALRTHCLKKGINALGCITGHVGTEQILDIIFRDFCIGK